MKRIFIGIIVVTLPLWLLFKKMRHQQKNKEISYVKKQMKEATGAGKNSNNNNKEDGIIREKNGSISCCVPFLKCARSGHPLPETLADGIKLNCTNPDCLYSKHLVHPECFRSLENSLMKVLNSSGYKYCKDKGVKLTQEKLWEPKGLALIQKNLKCECGKGIMSRDNEAWDKREALLKTTPAEEKEKKKHKPAPKLPALQLTVKKGAPPPPNFHKLDTHYLSSHSPPPCETSIEEKYGAPLSSVPAAITTTKMLDNYSVPGNRAALSKTSIINQSAIKVPDQYIPIGVDPLERLFSSPVKGVKQVEGISSSQIKQPIDRKPVAPAVAPQDCTVQAKEANATVGVQMKKDVEKSNALKHTVELKPAEVVEKHVEQRAPKPLLTPSNTKATPNVEGKFVERIPPKPELLPSNAAPKTSPASTLTSKFKSVEIQTHETSFPQTLLDRQRYKCYSSENSVYGSEAYSTSLKLSTSPSFTDSTDEFRTCRKSVTTTPSEFRSVSEASFSSFATMSDFCVKKPSTKVIFLFRNDEKFAVEIYQNGRKEMLRNVYGNAWSPLYFSRAEEVPKVGEEALLHFIKSPTFVVYDILKIMGKPMNQIDISPKWEFKIVENDGTKYFQVETLDGLRLLREISVVAAFLKAMKLEAENYLLDNITDVYLSTNFELNQSQKNVFKDGAFRIGLNILDFL